MIGGPKALEKEPTAPDNVIQDPLGSRSASAPIKYGARKSTAQFRGSRAIM